MALVLPTLSDLGWLQDKELIAQQLLDYFRNTLKDQTICYTRSNVSLRYILERYGSDFDLLKNKLEEALLQLYTKYYPEVDILIDIVETVDNDKRFYYLKILIDVTDEDGNTYSITDNVKIDDNFNLNKTTVNYTDELPFI